MQKWGRKLYIVYHVQAHNKCLNYQRGFNLAISKGKVQKFYGNLNIHILLISFY